MHSSLYCSSNMDGSNDMDNSSDDKLFHRVEVMVSFSNREVFCVILPVAL